MSLVIAGNKKAGASVMGWLLWLSYLLIREEAICHIVSYPKQSLIKENARWSW